MRIVDTLSRFKSIAAASLLLVLLAIGGVQAALFLAREATAQPPAFRWQALTAGAEQRRRLTLGADYEVFRRLRQRLRPGSILAVTYTTFSEYTTRMRLEPLLHPVAVIDVGDGAAASLGREGADFYLLDLRPASPASPPAGFELVEVAAGDAGSPFSLWKLDGSPAPPSPEYGAPRCAAVRRRG